MRLLEFNVHVARYADRSWYWQGSGQPWCTALFDASGRIDARVEAQVSNWLLHELKLHNVMDWDMSEPQKRLWLLDGPSLVRLAKELALAMHREWLLRVIDAARVRVLQAGVDERALRFVVEDLPGGLFHCCLPVLDFEVDPVASIGLKLKEAGARTLMALLQPAWRAVRGRAQLYFDRSHKLAEVPPLEALDCDQALELICGWLVPRRFPEWGWYF